MSRLNYVDYGGEQVYQQPFLAEGVRYYGFWLEANDAALQQNVCDRFFNLPCGVPGRFRPAGSLVLLAFCDLKALRSETAPYSNWGWFSERETATWVPVVDTERQRMFWSFPYIWVDNAYAMAMGREMYGFPKELGWFEFPADAPSAELFSIETLALPHFSPGTQGTRQRLIEVRRTQDSPEPAREFQSLAELAGEVLGFLEVQDDIFRELRLLFDTGDDLLHGRAPMVFLKQFRDAAEGQFACYQSIVSVVPTVTAFHGAGLLGGDYEVTVLDCDSHPIRRDLGLAAGPIHPAFSFWADFDMVVPAGEEIWKGA